MNETFGKDFFIGVKNNKVVICKNPEAHLVTWEDMNDPNKRYLYKEGDKILTPFGIQTIKTINREYGPLDRYHGHEWLIMVEENGNQYKPIELIGIVVSEIPIHIWNSITASKVVYTAEQHHLDMQYYMEYVASEGYITPLDWLANHKHY